LFEQSELGRSNQFIDSEGTGLLHRTAWAGAGSGVLFFDPNGTGAITQMNQYVFTAWDPTARGDLEALRNVFDSNGDGKLDVNDAKFSLFKVMITNAVGSQAAKTLGELGITAINLTDDQTDVRYADGPEITGHHPRRRCRYPLVIGHDSRCRNPYRQSTDHRLSPLANRQIVQRGI
jgi:trimeric autotransporter adhesin